MSTINVLSSKIYNRIAAGEVVERPASVVKELIENSIDANATKITVSILSGGIASICITDNGDGIEKSQLNKALLPHATSKISNIDDLYNISSLGFRGEALPSIASVSKLTVISKPLKQQFGAKIYSEGGNVGKVIDCASADGTEVTVENLFFNTPAREKFLRSERVEESEISITVARFILGNPNISFNYYSDGKLVLSSFGDGIESAFVSVYGASAIKECYYVDTEKNGVKIRGYIAKPEYAKTNRNYQTVFLNGRFIQNQTISSAIANAYSTYLMKRRYPFYLLNLLIPPDVVDCNVHPNKTDVRFQNNQIVYGAVYSVVSKVLDGTSEALNIIVDDKKNSDNNSDDYVTQNNKKDEGKIEETYKFDKLLFTDNFVENKSNVNENKSAVDDIFAENKKYLESLSKNNSIKNTVANEIIQPVIKLEKNLTVVGQALNTYLIFDDGEDLYIIDQHAAHERILFDKFNAQLSQKNIPTQPLLIAYVLNVKPWEYGFFCEKLNVFSELGIEIEEFGNNTFSVTAIPVCISSINLKTFFDDILNDLSTLKTISLNELLKDKIAQKACKAAIKSGDKLSDDDIHCLIELLKTNLGLKCPHGRPIAIKITRTEIDKWFKRII